MWVGGCVCISMLSLLLLFTNGVHMVQGEPVFSFESYDDCMYIFVWNTCGACPVGSDARTACKAPTHVAPSQMSGGTIFLIVYVPELTVSMRAL